MKLYNLFFVLLVGCIVPIQAIPKQELTIHSAQKTPCEQKEDIIRNLAGECYISIQHGCVKDNEKGRQPGECPSCDALDKVQATYDKECKTTNES